MESSQNIDVVLLCWLRTFDTVEEVEAWSLQNGKVNDSTVQMRLVELRSGIDLLSSDSASHTIDEIDISSKNPDEKFIHELFTSQDSNDLAILCNNPKSLAANNSNDVNFICSLFPFIRCH